MDTKELEGKLKSVGEHFRDELSGVRANRPSPKLLEDIPADYFGQKMPLKQLGSISIAPPRELQVSLWDANAVAPAAKAIESANLGVSVSVQGNMIRVALPLLSSERREELIKIVKGVAEESRRAVRGARDEANKKIDAAEKEKSITEDDKFSLKKKTQELTDRANKEIEEHLATKIKEIQE